MELIIDLFRGQVFDNQRRLVLFRYLEKITLIINSNNNDNNNN